MRDADLGELTGTALTNHIVRQTKSLQLRFVDEHLCDQLCSLCINVVRVQADVSENIIVDQGVLELLKAGHNQVAAVQGELREANELLERLDHRQTIGQTQIVVRELNLFDGHVDTQTLSQHA